MENTFRPSFPRRALHAIPIAGYFAKQHFEECGQAERDEIAVQIYSAINARGNQNSFFLYLRPFLSTGCVPVRIRHMQGWRHNLGSYGHSTLSDLETLLSTALEPSGFLLTVGEPGEYIGAGRLTLKETVWVREVKKLCAASTRIFFIPSCTKGVLKELQMILKTPAMLAKTIFVIPPSYPSDLEDDTLSFDVASTRKKVEKKKWAQNSREVHESSLEALRKFGIRGVQERTGCQMFQLDSEHIAKRIESPVEYEIPISRVWEFLTFQRTEVLLTKRFNEAVRRYVK